ncbi:MAG: hypothetical protein RR942_01310 [Romboutsia sp.]
MKKYECIKELQVDCYNDNGHYEEKENVIHRGSIWIIEDEEDKSRMIDGEIRLIKQGNNEYSWLEISNDTLEEYFKEIIEKDRVIQLNITDELGNHTLQTKDFNVKCSKCRKERPLYEDDIDENGMNPKMCDCGGFNRFHYWLDGVYTEEEYDELISKSKTIICF